MQPISDLNNNAQAFGKTSTAELGIFKKETGREQNNSNIIVFKKLNLL